MLKNNYSERQAEMRNLLETIATDLGAETGFVQRKSKMSASRFCQTMVLGSLEEGDKSLTEFAQVSQDLGVTITASGLNQRINHSAVICLEKLLAQSIAIKMKSGQTDELLANFSDVQLIDSSYMGLPKAMRELYPGLGRGWQRA